MKNRTRATALALAASLLLGAAACGDDTDPAAATGEGGSAAELSIVGFAVPEAANKAIAEQWTATAEGEGVTLKTSYGASGHQSSAVVAGLDADYVPFTAASHVHRLAHEGPVAAAWAARAPKRIGPSPVGGVTVAD